MTTTALIAKRAPAGLPHPETEIAFYLWLSVIGTIVVAAGLGLWLATATLVAATVTQGNLVVASEVKTVQHQMGGTIGEILVKEGDRVAAGDLLVRLDSTLARSNVQLVRKQLDEQYARQSRLVAERDGLADMTIGPDLSSQANDPEIAAMLRSERNLFESRRAAREGQRAQLRERVAQLRDETNGYLAQQAATKRQLDLARDELRGVQMLYDKNLVSISRLSTLEREIARLEGETGRLISAAAQTRGKITELDLQAIQIDTDLRNDVVKELTELEAKVAELTERLITTEDVLRHIDIRSPETGKVHQLAVHTVGGVIRPGEQLMLIVPAGDQLLIETKIPASEIDTIHVGQAATIKLSAFNARTTPEIEGMVSRISADLVKDMPTAPGYYLARVTIPDSELERIADQKLLPGMPVEVHLKGAERTALSYFMKPLMDQLGHAFRER